MRVSILAACAAVFLCAAPGTTGADLLFVSTFGFDGQTCLVAAAPCATIQRAINVAQDGDTIKVMAGFYDRTTIRLERPISNLIISGSWASDNFDARFGSPQTVLRQNLTSVQRLLTISAGNIDIGVSFERILFQEGGRGGAWVEASNGGHATVSFVGSRFKDNSAAFQGGGVYAEATGGGTITFEVSDCRFDGNYARESGGGFAVLAQGSGSRVDVLAARNTILRNGAGTEMGTLFDGAGGGVYLHAAGGATLVARLENNVLAENRVAGTTNPQGSALFLGSQDVISIVEVTSTNDTITNNSSSRGAYAVVTAGTVDLDIVNGIVRNILSLKLDPVSQIAIDYSDYSSISGGFADGGHNLNVDPAFVDPLSHDYHLDGNSPLIDAGICSKFVCTRPPNSVCYLRRVAPFEDFEGDARPDSGCDIGADEVVFVPEASGAGLALAALGTLAALRRVRRARPRTFTIT